MGSYIDKYARFAPDYDTEWGTWDNPFMPNVIAEREARGFPVPSQIHGRHEFRMQPRPLGPGVNYMAGFGGGPAPVGGSPYAMVQDYLPEDTKLSIILLIAAVGLLAYLWGHSSGVRKNPRRNPSRDACSNPECEACHKVRRVKTRQKRKFSSAKHRLACEAPRDAVNGRFVSQADIKAGRYK